ncbi:MAG TPA: hypothetical protein VFA52_01010 [Candidatus Paceibacterota bacterium]|nr:hypothetical protein [Candidatus Paceibacterota bacterium]
MKYKVEYSITGAESGGNNSATFEADDDTQAPQKADELVAQKERECNQYIKSPFWHYKFKRTALYRVKQEEITEPILS